MKYSIIIITHNRNELLRNCLKSIQEATHSNSHEIIVIINGDDNDTVHSLSSINQDIKWRTIEATTPGQARNIAIEMSSYSFLCFLDDDTIVPKQYFEIAMPNLTKDLAILGGPDKTYPNSTLFEEAIGETLKSPLATGNTRYRHDSTVKENEKHPSEKCFILCNLWINKSILNKNKLRFDPEFYRNEENVLLHGLMHEKLQHDKRLFVYHKRKGNVIHLLNAVSKSAFFRVKSFYKYPSSFSIMYLSPFLGFILFITSVVIMPPLASYLLGFYTLSIVWFSLRHANYKLFPYIFCIHILIHCGYSAGILLGIILNFPKKLLGQLTN